MPSPTRRLTAGDARQLIAERACPARLPSGAPRLGVELEWLTFSIDDPCARILPADIQQALLGVTLPGGGAVTIEPGGQVELSTLPFVSMSALLEATSADIAVLHGALAAAGIRTVGSGLDTHRRPERVLDRPRYEAMEAYFDVDGVAGRTMMCNTAAIQVNVDFVDPPRQWRIAHEKAPELARRFTNSDRSAVWAALDASRTRPVGGDEPRAAWASYAMSARVMFINLGEECLPVHEPMTLADWVGNGHRLGWPTEADVDLHLTTLFPPIRPRGFLELRMLDAQPGNGWVPAIEAVAELLLEVPSWT